jgi:hypothetical protein
MTKAQITQMGIWDTIDSHYKTVDQENARLTKLRTDREAEVKRLYEEKKAAQPQPQAVQAAPFEGRRRTAGKA